MASSEYAQNKALDRNTPEFTKKVLQEVEQHFGTTDILYYGPTFILPNGKFLNLSGYKHHSAVEHFLIDIGLSDCPKMDTNGSPTLSALGGIRCDLVKYYLQLPNIPITSQQCNSLLLWLDYFQRFVHLIYVVSPDGTQEVRYSFSEYISDDILDRIQHYYRFGKLREEKEKLFRAKGYIAKRNPIGYGFELTESFQQELFTANTFMEAYNKLSEVKDDN